MGSARLPAAISNWRLGRNLRGHGPGLAHVHAPQHYGVLRWGLSRAGVDRIAHVHLEEDVGGLRWAFREPPELIVTCARFLVDLVNRALPYEALGRTRVKAIPNAVDTERFAPGRKDQAKKLLGVPSGRPLVLMLANLAPHKGQETVIRATAILKQRGVDVNCWLAGVERGGEGHYTQRLRSLIAEAGVEDRICLLGQRSDAPDLLRAADFFLLPSTCEGLPLSVLEAQATKVPVLAAPTAGIPEVVNDGTTGFLIPAGDAEGYAQRMSQLLADAGQYRQVVEAAHAHTTRQHNWTTYCRRILELYEETIADKPRKQPWFGLAGRRVREGKLPVAVSSGSFEKPSAPLSALP